MSKIIINNNTIQIEIADTPEKIVKGLSGEDSLPQNSGMLFIYPDYKIRQFWMKEMQFSIDIIWLKDDLIVGITQNIPAPTSTNLLKYPSNQPVNHVLELNSGWVEKNKIKIGDRVEFIR